MHLTLTISANKYMKAWMKGRQRPIFTANLRLQGWCVCACVCVGELLANSTQSRLAAEAARLTGCKAISLFGNTVVSVCGLELTPEQLSHAKCSTITGFCSWSKTPLPLRFMEEKSGNKAKNWIQISRALFRHMSGSIATSLKTTEG